MESAAFRPVHTLAEEIVARRLQAESATSDIGGPGQVKNAEDRLLCQRRCIVRFWDSSQP
jgi:hypothetical protein